MNYPGASPLDRRPDSEILTGSTKSQIPTIVDGDTVKVAGVRIRLTDYDSPELFSPKCPREYALAWQAKQELEKLLSKMELKIVPCAFANYGMRRSDQQRHLRCCTHDQSPARQPDGLQARILPIENQLVCTMIPDDPPAPRPWCPQP
jgi:endonuclease YncB( thermonuclease family)